MRWHIELLIEAALLGILIWRKPGLRWFESLIGVDLIAGILQIIPYRAHYRGISRLIWIGGIVLALPLGWLALVEAAELERSSRQYWHVRILAAWLMVMLCCVSLQTQQDLVIPVNHALLACNAAAFISWSVLFLTET